MSREIKFRAWDAANRRMEYNDFYIHQKTGLCHYFGDSVGVGSSPEFYDCGEEEPALMQFTGLKDKNGIEIYEGDILETPMRNIVEVFWGEKIYRFGRDEVQCFGWMAKKIKSGQVETLDDSMFGKIIGNIYQNPELIEQKNLSTSD